MVDEVAARPELIVLEPDARSRVAEQVAAQGAHCETCGATDLDVGHAMYLGFLFLDEDSDAYLVALTCRNPDCGSPRSAIKLRDRDFLTSDRGASAAG